MITAYTLAAVFVIACCVMGIFHRAFKDNLLQCVAMAMLSLALAGRLADVFARQEVSSAQLLAIMAMAVYAAGTAQKIIIQHGNAEGWAWLQKLQAWHAGATDHGGFDSRPHPSLQDDK